MASPGTPGTMYKERESQVNPSEVVQNDQEAAPKQWTPFLLTPQVPAVLAALMVLAAIALQVGNYAIIKNNGWQLPPLTVRGKDYIHYAYTWIPVVLVMGLVSAIAGADMLVLKLVPYMELSRANGAKGETLLLDYTGESKFLVWILQLQNRHYLAFLSTVIVLMLLGLQPLASSLFVLLDTEVVLPPIGVPRFGTVGINDTLNSLHGFSSAAGFAEADARYDLGRPPFVWRTWAVDEFERPTSFISNGTMQANTTGIQTLPNCVSGSDVSFTQTGGSYRLTGKWNDCTFDRTFTADNDDDIYGVDVTSSCTSQAISGLADPVKPVVFWFATKYLSTGSLVFCQPKLSLHNVIVTVNLANGQLINVVPVGDYALASNVTSGPPLNGNVWNGVQFNLTNSDAGTLVRANSTRLQLSQAAFLLMQRNGLQTVLQDQNQVLDITATRYQLYLALSARSNYFVTDRSGSKVMVAITEIQQRLWMSKLSTHLGSAILFVGAILLSTLHYLHWKQRKGMKLYAPPSIATAAGMANGSPMLNILHSDDSGDKQAQALRNRQFGVDPFGKIVLLDQK
ncbi:SubName: Full=Uncharacterized protein {ECO:0000313/EMBL:CCA69527.1} [Serendipita indica DSM 11827]|uniref:Uncharacterized protein n=1 Tax=Serendipita indica (strain DSM 11827) TaxID=1109443 RepID=G4TDW9_SERID|nr:SubName: Full=Uncharacterized protein {ECO:0000313/EMBL:CCA69527.1} [Serendipita indica DSM 11827]CCA69527.1 hypothetical protein PIIN_03466 [Serendipita indica DSM 11827]